MDDNREFLHSTEVVVHERLMQAWAAILEKFGAHKDNTVVIPEPWKGLLSDVERVLESIDQILEAQGH